MLEMQNLKTSALMEVVKSVQIVKHSVKIYYISATTDEN